MLIAVACLRSSLLLPFSLSSFPFLSFNFCSLYKQDIKPKNKKLHRTGRTVKFIFKLPFIPLSHFEDLQHLLPN